MSDKKISISLDAVTMSEIEDYKKFLIEKYQLKDYQGYKFNLSKFIRGAIKEKIDRECN